VGSPAVIATARANAIVDSTAVEIDFDQLAARILRPDRPRLAEAQAAVAGITDPREAWETLAIRDVIPASWVNDPGRKFARAGKHGAPGDLSTAVALAADPEGVAAAEALAVEFAHRLEVWCPGSASRRVVWRTRGRRHHANRLRDSSVHQRPAALLEHALTTAADRATFNKWLRWRDEPPRVVTTAWLLALQDLTRDIALAKLWDHATANDWRVPASVPYTGPAIPPTLRGAPFAATVAPLDPLLSIWWRGYALAAMTDDALVLVAPAVSDDD
jgi:hypothetical protein